MWKTYQSSQVFAKKFCIVFFWYVILSKIKQGNQAYTQCKHIYSSWAAVIGTILNTCVPAQIPSGSCTNVKEVFIKWDTVCLLSTSFSSLISATSGDTLSLKPAEHLDLYSVGAKSSLERHGCEMTPACEIRPVENPSQD